MQGDHVMWEPTEQGFEDFVESVGPRLRHAFVARYGPDVGSEATSEALAYAWENWKRVTTLKNPAGWVYRAGQSRSRRFFRKPTQLPVPQGSHNPTVEPELPKCLARLSDKQRTAVMLVHAFGYTVRETADLLGVSPSTVQRNAARALANLREGLGVSTHV